MAVSSRRPRTSTSPRRKGIMPRARLRVRRGDARGPRLYQLQRHGLRLGERPQDRIDGRRALAPLSGRGAARGPHLSDLRPCRAVPPRPLDPPSTAPLAPRRVRPHRDETGGPAGRDASPSTRALTGNAPRGSSAFSTTRGGRSSATAAFERRSSGDACAGLRSSSQRVDGAGGGHAGRIRRANSRRTYRRRRARRGGSRSREAEGHATTRGALEELSPDRFAVWAVIRPWF